jgi:anti-sigma factor RsiW
MSAITCEGFVAHMGDYVDGTLARDERSRMAEHALACPHCAEAFAQYERIPDVVRSATDVKLSPDARVRLRRLLTIAWRSRS